MIKKKIYPKKKVSCIWGLGRGVGDKVRVLGIRGENEDFGSYILDSSPCFAIFWLDDLVYDRPQLQWLSQCVFAIVQIWFNLVVKLNPELQPSLEAGENPFSS